jgi:HPt (histidine-containing phosphotransfer) domain-containing protein
MTDSALIIDPQAIENLRALNPGDNDDFLREITGIFLEDTPLRIAELDESFEAGDVAKFARAAHSIKGSSANLGAVALRTVAEKLENEARTTGIRDLGGLVEQLRTEFTRAESALGALIGR